MNGASAEGNEIKDGPLTGESVQNDDNHKSEDEDEIYNESGQLSGGEDDDAGSDDGNDEEIYEGQKNEKGQPHGRGSLYYGWEKLDGFHGRFNNGIKEGKGSFIFADGSTLSGNFMNE